MIFFPVSFGLLLHVLFWGAGLALLVTPRRWRRLWPLFMAPCGLALQSAVVWAGAHTTLPGTDAYAWWAELLPVALLVPAWRRRGGVVRDLGRWAGLGAVMALCLGLLVRPLARSNRELTTVSLGSCDAADYAAGMRVLQEFARDDRSGFLGLTEVVRVGSADNFFDFWLRLNHFTPSALMALNGSVFGLAPPQIISAFTAVLLVLTLPLVWLLARSTAGFGPRASGWLTLLYGLSPVNWYAVYHVAPGQIIAAQAIALVTWAALAGWREPGAGRRGPAYAGLLGVGFGLIWGAYNFIMLVALVPALATVGGLALWEGKIAKLGRWGLGLLVPLAASGLFFWERVAGLVERFLLFRQYDFGWKIPLLRPEGWLGAVGNARLEALPGPGSWLFGTMTVLALVTGWLALRRRDGRRAWQAAACLLPVMAGYAYLQWRGVTLGSNASYDAYKLFAVFLPVLLVALCPWLCWLGDRRRILRGLAVGLMVVVTALNLGSVRRFAAAAAVAPLAVDADLSGLQQVETMPEVTSVNLRVPDFWTRLWANAFMLRKPQYFETHTYEGRLNTALRGEWDCHGGLLHVALPAPDSRQVNALFSVVRTASPHFLRASLGAGWYAPEQLRRGKVERWNWNNGDATIEIDNPQARPLAVVLHLSARSLVPREVRLWQDGRLQGAAPVGLTAGPVSLPAVVVPPGRSELRLGSDLPPVQAAGDTRPLGLAVYELILEVQPAAGTKELAR